MVPLVLWGDGTLQPLQTSCYCLRQIIFFYKYLPLKIIVKYHYHLFQIFNSLISFKNFYCPTIPKNKSFIILTFFRNLVFFCQEVFHTKHSPVKFDFPFLLINRVMGFLSYHYTYLCIRNTSLWIMTLRWWALLSTLLLYSYIINILRKRS